VLEFDIDIDPELVEPEFKKWGKFEQDLPVKMQAEYVSLSIARDMIAWLSFATRSWIALSQTSAGACMGSLGPSKTVPLDRIKNDFEDLGHREILQIDNGEFEEIKRPDFRLFPLDRTDLKLPSDFHRLTEKLFSINEENRDRFLEASASYMFALQNKILYPTVSLISFCISIESILETSKPENCKYKKGYCEYKREVGKKFRQLFQEHVPNSPECPLDNINNFIKRIYKKRSQVVHEGLLWKLRGPSLSFPSPSRENDYLEMLVNIALTDWLDKK
jgi:hypothetical protein